MELRDGVWYRRQSQEWDGGSIDVPSFMAFLMLVPNECVDTLEINLGEGDCDHSQRLTVEFDRLATDAEIAAHLLQEADKGCANLSYNARAARAAELRDRATYELLHARYGGYGPLRHK